MYIPLKRDSSLSKKNEIFIIIFVAIIFPLTLCAIGVFLARYLRQRYYEPKYIPGQFLKKKWRLWTPGSASYGHVPTQPTVTRTRDTSYRGAGRSNPEMSTTSGVQRDTSVRSVMTLPSYSASPNPTEQIIGREGERAGMDMVVEFPETVEEEETRREEQMDALYQIRVQRRQQVADREARRQERRDARARGDALRMDLLNRESRHGRVGRPSAAAIIAEHRNRERNRRIASVSYAEIGHVRHDGTRLRADSDSDSRPLLQSASSPSLEDPLTLQLTQQSSFASSTRTTETYAGGTELDPLVLAPTATHESALSSRSILQIEEDLGAQEIPPPEYDHLDWGDAPAYESPEGPERESLEIPEDSENTQVPESPFQGRNREPRPLSETPLPSLSLPSIHIEVASPVLSPLTPTVSNTDMDQEPTTSNSPLQSSAAEHIPVSP
ncbi:hypothetical protein N7495_006811 [Penicillium taxi]|uniref:uncharacterized protein n=1 Tax=Penicillium taxi TaxID=168475 RepID=UPI00254585A5|nr:uncharacterized protein N7495_006811 [Penicillium taxi]KAJ5895120.1 hypothetical protein N7495_006811 [Penicillium taxi]